MSTVKNKGVRLTSPKGIARFPWLNRPNTKFDPDGVYKTGLLLDPEEHAEFILQLDELTQQAVEKAQQDLIKDKKKAQAKQVKAQVPYVPETDDEGEETGRIEVRFKQRAKITLKDGRVLNLAPKIFDSTGKLVDPETVQIYGGSVIRINFTPSFYYVAATKMAGVTLRINAVQIIELADQGGDVSDYGFGVEEGGFKTESFEGTSSSSEGDEEEDDDDVTEGDF